jgi:hypothetical protein
VTAPDNNVAVTATVTDTGPALTNGTVTLQLLDAYSTLIGQQPVYDQSFTTGASHTYTWTARVPSTVGICTLALAVTNATGTPQSAQPSTASVNVVAPTPALDTAYYNFENGTQGWFSTGGMITGVSSSSARSYAGTHSLAVNIDASEPGTEVVYVDAPPLSIARPVTFNVWVPANSNVTAVTPYVMQGPQGFWRWTSNVLPINPSDAGMWNAITVQPPANALAPFYQMGVEFTVSGAWSGTCYLDSITW